MIQVQLKLRPTKAQARQFDLWLWRLTGVWNWAVRKIELDAAAGVYYTSYSLKAFLNGHGAKIGVSQVAVSGTVGTAYDAWRRCFKKLGKKPRLKGMRRPLSSIAFSHWENVRPRGKRIKIPIVGLVRFHAQEIPAGRIGAARIVKRASGWYLCLFVHADPIAVHAVADSAVGIDPGFSSLLTLSTGEKIDHPHEWSRGELRLAQAQRGRRTKLTARLQERIRNRRKNRNHHLSRRLVAENSLIAFSADQHRNIARAFGKSVGSAGHYQLRQMLAYKSLTGGRQYIEVASRNSTRACSSCGALTGPTGWAGLSVRTWTCGCGATHDRDCNAAMNTLRLGLERASERRREAVSGIAS